MCFLHPSATHLQLALQCQIRWHIWKARAPTHLLVAFASLSSAMSYAYPASGTSQFSAPSSLSSLHAFPLPGALCCLCFTTITCLALWAPSAAPSIWRLATEATSLPLSGLTWTFHLPAFPPLRHQLPNWHSSIGCSSWAFLLSLNPGHLHGVW